MTFTPIGRPARILKVAIAFLARVMTAFWPAIAVRSFSAAWIFLVSASRFARADVQHDLVDLRNLHGVLVAELLHQLGTDDVVVALLEARHVVRDRARASPTATCVPALTFAPSWRSCRPWLGLGLRPFGLPCGASGCLILPQTSMTSPDFLAKRTLAAVAQNLPTDARRLARLGIDMREVRQMDRAIPC